MRSNTGFLLLFVALMARASSTVCGEPGSPGPMSAPPVTVIDSDVRMLLSDAGVLKTMHGIVARHGMRFSELTRKQETGSIVAYQVTFMGGRVPQDTGTFTVRMAMEGPPPVTWSIISVSEVTFQFTEEGPPPGR